MHSLANGPEVTKPLLETSRKVGIKKEGDCCESNKDLYVDDEGS